MKRWLIVGLLLLVVGLPLRGQTTVTERSAHAADSCRPWVRWWWNGDKVERAELLRELHELHDAGIGGVEINPIEFPAKRCDSLGKVSLTWLSDEWLDMLDTVLREAKHLGMGCDLIVGTGWPFGAESTPMRERAQVMLVYATKVDWQDGKPFVITKQQIFDAVDPKVTEKNPDRQFELVALFMVPDSVSDIHQRHNINIPHGDTISIPSNFQFSILYALVRCTSFASVINGAPGGAGPIIDHLNATAVRRYLSRFQSRLESRIGPMSKWLRAYFVDSMELEGSNWTDDFAEEFRRRNGYDLMPWLPFVLFPSGRLGEVSSYDYGARKSPAMQKEIRRVRLDFERTKAQLLYERFTAVFADWCKAQGVLSRGQAYGRGFFPLESSLAYDIPEGESWTTNYLRHRVGEEMPDGDYRRGRAYTMINKYVSSAAHQAGRRVVSCEEMTNTYRMFETTLELLKLGSDMSAFSGVTHSVWHGFNYSPPEAGFPGWVQYGSYLNRQNSWWPYFHLLNEYRAHMSAVLQNAEMQTDIAILLPTDSLWAQYGVQTEPFPYYPKGSPYDIPCLLWEAVHKNGGNCDFVTRRQLDTATVRDGKLIVGKKAYKVLLLPPGSTIDSTKFSIINSQFSILEVPSLPGRNYLDWYRTVQQQYRLPRAVEIEDPDRFLLQNHYRNVARSESKESELSLPSQATSRRNNRGDDIFLFVNAYLDTAVATTLHFPKDICQGRTAWVYNAATDEKQRLQLEEGSTWLYIPPAESLFIIFDKQDKSTDKQLNISTYSPAYNEGQHYFSIPMQWHLTLHHAIEGWTCDTVMRELCDLRETRFKDFSGTITYTAKFYLDSITDDTLQNVAYTPESLDCIDLGAVYDICELKVNGTDCGVKWYGERSYCNLGGLFHPGDNTIEVKVTTTLNNYVHTLTDNGVVQHFVIKRNVPTTPAGLVGPVMFY